MRFKPHDIGASKLRQQTHEEGADVTPFFANLPSYPKSANTPVFTQKSRRSMPVRWASVSQRLLRGV